MNLRQVLYKYRIHPEQATTRTDLTSEKDRIVQQNYLLAALPSLSGHNREAFPDKLFPVFLANVKSGFFDRILLAQRLYKMRNADK